MRVSVIVPVYNEEKTVNQVRDMRKHISLDLEVIIVDDASTGSYMAASTGTLPASSVTGLGPIHVPGATGETLEEVGVSQKMPS